MDGKNSEMFLYFKQKLYNGFVCLRKHVEDFITILEIMKHESDLPCFEKFDIKAFQERFMTNISENEVIDYQNKIVNDSY